MREHAFALVLLAGVAGGFWVHRVLIERPASHGAGDHDLVRYFHPLAEFMHRELRSGRLPVWNPHQLAGVPLLAAHGAGVLYPPTLVSLRFLPPNEALEGHLLLHLVLAGFGTWLFTRRLGLGAPACGAAACGFMLAGQVLRWQYNVVHLSTVAWLPTVLWAAHGLRSAQVRWAALAAVALAFAFLGGWAQGFLFELQLAAVYWLVGMVLWTPPARRLRAVAVAGVGAILFLALTAAQLIPTLELMATGTRRLGGLLASEANLGALDPTDLLRGLLGQPPRTAPSSMAGWIPWREASAALLTLPLVALGLADRPRRAHWRFFLAVSSFAALFMLGHRTPIYRLYYSLPMGDAFRVPSRLGFVYAFGLAVLLAIGVQGATVLLGRWHRTAAMASTVGVILAVAVGADLYARTALPFTRPILHDASHVPERMIASLRRLAGSHRLYVFESEDGPGRPWTHPKLATANGLFVAPDYESLLPGDYQAFLASESTRLWKGRAVWTPIARADGSATGVERLLDLMSVRYYLFDRSDPPASYSQLVRRLGRPRGRLGPVSIHERARAVPRAYLVHEVEHEPDRARARTRLLAPDFDPRRVAIVAEAPPSLAPLPAGSRESARIVSQGQTEVALSVVCRSACLLVLTDLAYPGWIARVDGVERPIHTVNLLFRGIGLEPGRHEVVFDYTPRLPRVALWISACTGALIAAGACVAVRRAPSSRGVDERRRAGDNHIIE